MRIIGHRGACGYKPENTLASFMHALQLGVSMIELDVHVCKTGELVVIHDDDVARVTNGSGLVADLTLQELQSFKVMNAERIPTLAEVISYVDKHIPINIELKGVGIAQQVAQVLQQYIKDGWHTKDFIISSFDHDQVVFFKALMPSVSVGLLFEQHESLHEIIVKAQATNTQFVGLDVAMITEELVEQLHQHNFMVYAWTVNSQLVADRLRACKVDAIFSDYPDKVTKK